MSVNGITKTTSSYETRSTDKTVSNQTTDSQKTNQASEPAAVYEKGEEPAAKKNTYSRDDLTIERLKSDAENRAAQLRELVRKLLLKQGKTMDEATDIYSLLREGKLEVDPETREQAQKDIAEDGYWGVEQTSERMVSFAKALTGGDPSKADKMIEAIKKGYKDAEKAWGGELPEICKKTLDATIKKLESWRDGVTNSDNSEA